MHTHCEQKETKFSEQEMYEFRYDPYRHPVLFFVRKFTKKIVYSVFVVAQRGLTVLEREDKLQKLRV